MLWPYYLLLFMCLSFAVVSNKSHKDLRALSFFLFALVLISLFAGLREGDRDYFVYQQMYSDTPEVENFSLSNIAQLHGEPGYLLLTSVAKSIGVDFNYFLVFVAFLSVSLTGAATFRLSLVPIISLGIYFSHVFLLREMMQIRAGLAISILLYVMAFHRRNSHLLGGCLLASLFHTGALIVLPVIPFISRIKFSFSKYIFLLLVALLLSSIHAFEYLLDFLSDVGLLPSSVKTYVGWSLYDYKLKTLTNPVTWKVLITLYCLRRYGPDELGEPLHRLRNLYAVGLIVMILFSDMAILAGRLSTFFFCAEHILIVWAFLKQKNAVVGFSFLSAIAILQLSMNLILSKVHEGYGVFFL